MSLLPPPTALGTLQWADSFIQVLRFPRDLSRTHWILNILRQIPWLCTKNLCLRLSPNCSYDYLVLPTSPLLIDFALNHSLYFKLFPGEVRSLWQKLHSVGNGLVWVQAMPDLICLPLQDHVLPTWFNLFSICFLGYGHTLFLLMSQQHALITSLLIGAKLPYDFFMLRNYTKLFLLSHAHTHTQHKHTP